VVLVGLLVTLVLALLSTLVLVLSTTSPQTGNPVRRVSEVVKGSTETQETREEVMAQTEQFMLRLGSYGPELLDEQGGMPEYREKVKEVITPKFAASFDTEAGTAEQLVAQAGVSRVPDVFATGVASLDDDSAQTLVAGSFSDTYDVDGEEIKQEPIPFRISVSLVKIDGEWLVDDFGPVNGDGAGEQQEPPQ
jgi:Mce-associated membrane protein